LKLLPVRFLALSHGALPVIVARLGAHTNDALLDEPALAQCICSTPTDMIRRVRPSTVSLRSARSKAIFGADESRAATKI
jgi:hypothetical protein